jgi:hypothetical protein
MTNTNTMRTAKPVTINQIASLRVEAIHAGDWDQVILCDLALDGSVDTDDYTVLSPAVISRVRGRAARPGIPEVAPMTQDQARAECAAIIEAGLG